MKKSVIMKLSSVVMLLIFAFAVFAGDISAPLYETARTHLEVLAKTARVTGTDEAKEACDYISAQFEKQGYDVTLQEFSERGDNCNVIAEIKDENDTRPTIVVGAHYDSVSKGGSKGADDNASGVSALLTISETIYSAAEELPYHVIFIAFDTEEPGLLGSKHYVKELLKADGELPCAMINLDSIISGDKLYIYAGRVEDADLLDFAIERAEALELPINRQDVSDTYEAGTTGDWSDHAPFKAAGVPTLYFEATNWDIDPDGGFIQTEAEGEIMHSGKDTVEFIDEHFPGRADTWLDACVRIVAALLASELPVIEGTDDAVADYIGLCSSF